MPTYEQVTQKDPLVFEEMGSWWNRQPGPKTTPFLRSEWFGLWQQCFLPQRARLEVGVWRVRGSEPVAVLPMYRTGLRRYSLSNSHCDVFDLVGGAPDDLLEDIRDWLTRGPVARLHRLDAESRLRSSEPDTRFIVDDRAEAPFIDLSQGADAVVAKLRRSLVNDILRCEKRLDELGEVTYIDNAEPEIPGILERCFEVEASGWKRESGTAMASRPETHRFYRELVELAAARGWLSLGVLLVAERLAAFQLNLDYAGRRFLLKIGYDESFRPQSPGKVLQWRVVHAAAEKGLITHDLGGEAEGWKQQWADRSRSRISTLSFGESGWARLVGGPLRRIAKSRARRASG